MKTLTWGVLNKCHLFELDFGPGLMFCNSFAKSSFKRLFCQGFKGGMLNLTLSFLFFVWLRCFFFKAVISLQYLFRLRFEDLQTGGGARRFKRFEKQHLHLFASSD